MKSLKKVLMLLLVGCGVAWGLTGCGNGDHSSKDAVIDAFIKAANENDKEAFVACFPEKDLEAIKKQDGEGKYNKFVEDKMKAVKGSNDSWRKTLKNEKYWKQLDGKKWYLDPYELK